MVSRLWDQNFYEPRLGGPAFMEQLHQRGRLNNGEQLEYAFGLILGNYRGLPVVEHAGGDAGYRAHLLRFPEQRFSVACLCNAGPVSPGQFARRIADIYLAEEMKEPAPPVADGEKAVSLSTEQLSNKVGLYWNRESDAFRKISLKEGKLHQVFPEESFEMKPLSATRFRIAERPTAELRFDPAAPGAPLRLAESFTGGKPEFFERVDEFTPARAELGDYPGTYLSDEMEAIYRVALQDDHLVLKRLKRKTDTLQPALRDVFTATVGTIRFTRDPNHRVSGFLLNSGRIRNFRFTRQSQ